MTNKKQNSNSFTTVDVAKARANYAQAMLECYKNVRKLELQNLTEEYIRAAIAPSLFKDTSHFLREKIINDLQKQLKTPSLRDSELPKLESTNISSVVDQVFNAYIKRHFGKTHNITTKHPTKHLEAIANQANTYLTQHSTEALGTPLNAPSRSKFLSNYQASKSKAGLDTIDPQITKALKQKIDDTLKAKANDENSTRHETLDDPNFYTHITGSFIKAYQEFSSDSSEQNVKGVLNILEQARHPKVTNKKMAAGLDQAIAAIAFAHARGTKPFPNAFIYNLIEENNDISLDDYSNDDIAFGHLTFYYETSKYSQPLQDLSRALNQCATTVHETLERINVGVCEKNLSKQQKALNEIANAKVVKTPPDNSLSNNHTDTTKPAITKEAKKELYNTVQGLISDFTPVQQEAILNYLFFLPNYNNVNFSKLADGSGFEGKESKKPLKKLTHNWQDSLAILTKNPPSISEQNTKNSNKSTTPQMSRSLSDSYRSDTDVSVESFQSLRQVQPPEQRSVLLKEVINGLYKELGEPSGIPEEITRIIRKNLLKPLRNYNSSTNDDIGARGDVEPIYEFLNKIQEDDSKPQTKKGEAPRVGILNANAATLFEATLPRDGNGQLTRFSKQMSNKFRAIQRYIKDHRYPFYAAQAFVDTARTAVEADQQRKRTRKKALANRNAMIDDKALRSAINLKENLNKKISQLHNYYDDDNDLAENRIVVQGHITANEHDESKLEYGTRPENLNRLTTAELTKLLDQIKREKAYVDQELGSQNNPGRINKNVAHLENLPGSKDPLISKARIWFRDHKLAGTVGILGTLLAGAASLLLFATGGFAVAGLAAGFGYAAAAIGASLAAIVGISTQRKVNATEQKENKNHRDYQEAKALQDHFNGYKQDLEREANDINDLISFSKKAANAIRKGKTFGERTNTTEDIALSDLNTIQNALQEHISHNMETINFETGERVHRISEATLTNYKDSEESKWQNLNEQRNGQKSVNREI